MPRYGGVRRDRPGCYIGVTRRCDYYPSACGSVVRLCSFGWGPTPPVYENIRADTALGRATGQAKKRHGYRLQGSLSTLVCGKPEGQAYQGHIRQAVQKLVDANGPPEVAIDGRPSVLAHDLLFCPVNMVMQHEFGREQGGHDAGCGSG